MSNIILFDDESRGHLLPLTYTRPIGALRVGLCTIAEKWEQTVEGTVSYITQKYLSEKFPIQIVEDNLVINGSVLPNDRLVRLIRQLELNEALLYNDELIAARLDRRQFDHLLNDEQIDELKGYKVENTPVTKISRLQDLLKEQSKELERDFRRITQGRKSASVPEYVHTTGKGDIFISEGAEIHPCTLNPSSGPIYIGKEATVMEGCSIRGGLGLGAHSTLKMGSRLYGPVTAGPHTKLGGEINHSIIQGYSNKGHDGFLGHAILGEWCNIGADSNNSNLKNNYGSVKIWNYPAEQRIDSGRLFMGLIMGDHSKCGINTMFNTGTVVGVGANVFGSGFPPAFIPSFSWGGSGEMTTHRFEKAFETARRVMGRRNRIPDDIDKKILREVFRQSAVFRSWESNGKN